MRFRAGPGDAILDHAAEIVALVAVDESVVDANVGQPARKQQRIDTEPPQQDFQIGAVEGRVAAFLDEVVPVAEVDHLLRERRFRVVVEAVDILATVEFPAEIHQVGAMDLLNEDDRDAHLSRPVDGEAGPGDPLGIVRHVRDRANLLLDEGGLLDVDHDQGRPAFDQAALASSRIGHARTSFRSSRSAPAPCRQAARIRVQAAS